AAMPSSPNDFSNDHAGCRLGTAPEVLATKGPRLSEHLSRLWPLRQAGRPVLISGPAPAGLARMGVAKPHTFLVRPARLAGFVHPRTRPVQPCDRNNRWVNYRTTGDVSAPHRY